MNCSFEKCYCTICLFVTLTVRVKASIYGKGEFFPTGFYKLIIHDKLLPQLVMSSRKIEGPQLAGQLFPEISRRMSPSRNKLLSRVLDSNFLVTFYHDLFTKNFFFTQILEKSSCKFIQEFHDHSGRVKWCAFSKCGQVLVSVSDDSTAKVTFYITGNNK